MREATRQRGAQRDNAPSGWHALATTTRSPVAFRFGGRVKRAGFASRGLGSFRGETEP